jgi:hypothetical protein
MTKIPLFRSKNISYSEREKLLKGEKVKMFNFTKKDKRTNLVKEIDSVIEYMEDLAPHTEDYAACVKNLEVLYKCQSLEKDKWVSPDTMAMIGGNIIMLFGVLKYEQLNVLTSKAMQFLVKGRVI